MPRYLLVLFGALVLAGCDSATAFRLPPLETHGPSPAATLEVINVQSAPVMDPGSKGEFDSSDVLNPSVVRSLDGELWNFYSGFDGKTWHTGLATWSGGAWTKA